MSARAKTVGVSLTPSNYTVGSSKGVEGHLEGIDDILGSVGPGAGTLIGLSRINFGALVVDGDQSPERNVLVLNQLYGSSGTSANLWTLSADETVTAFSNLIYGVKESADPDGVLVYEPNIAATHNPRVEGLVRTQTAGTPSSDGYITYVGFIELTAVSLTITRLRDNTLANAHIRYDPSQDGNDNFWAYSTDGAGNTQKTDTGVTIAVGTDYKLRVDVNATAGEVKFYVNDSLVATHSTYVPAITVADLNAILFVDGTVDSYYRYLLGDHGLHANSPLPT